VNLTNSGSLSLTLPANRDYTLKVRANKIETSGLRGFHGNMDNKNIDGTTGNGGPQIDIRSSQRVSLTFR
jgi:hypothetical protein